MFGWRKRRRATEGHSESADSAPSLWDAQSSTTAEVASAENTQPPVAGSVESNAKLLAPPRRSNGRRGAHASAPARVHPDVPEDAVSTTTLAAPQARDPAQGEAPVRTVRPVQRQARSKAKASHATSRQDDTGEVALPDGVILVQIGGRFFVGQLVDTKTKDPAQGWRPIADPDTPNYWLEGATKAEAASAYLQLASPHEAESAISGRAPSRRQRRAAR
jgi:hypothetical protein